MLITLFSMKVLAGVLYGWFYMQPVYFATSDTWHFFNLSKNETDWLFKDPVAFFKDIFFYGYERSGNLFLGENSYWNDLKSNVIIKLLAICNVFTFKNYWADVVFFNFLSFFGPVALYRIIRSLFKINNYVLIVAVFLIPSFLFWCSGVHKDGLIFTCVAVIMYHFYVQLQAKKIVWRSLSIALFLFIVIFALRNFMALLLFASLAVWLLSYAYSKKAKLILVSLVIAGLLFFMFSGYLNNSLDMQQYIIEKQNEFKQLSGASAIAVPALEHNAGSFLQFLPTAIDIAFFRPHFTEIKNYSYLPAIAETLLFWVVVFISLFLGRGRKTTNEQKAFIYCCLLFSISFLLLAGYTITFSGAIVRYRAVVLPFLFVPLLNNISFITEKIIANRKTLK